VGGRIVPNERCIYVQYMMRYDERRLFSQLKRKWIALDLVAIRVLAADVKVNACP
jgi:hypothetical protein